MTLIDLVSALARCTLSSTAGMRAASGNRSLAGFMSLRERAISMHLLHALRTASLSVSLRTPLLALPHRVLLDILHELPLNDQLAMSHACRALRQLCLAEPELWCRIAVAPQHVLGTRCLDMERTLPPHVQWAAICQLLTRSGTHVQRVFSILDVSSCNITSYIARALSTLTLLRIEPYKRIRFRFSDQLETEPTHSGMLYPFLNDWDRFVPALESIAPTLRSLQLVITQKRMYASEDCCTLPESLLSGRPHELRSVLLCGIRLPNTGCLAFSALVVFDYQPIDADFTSQQVCDILAQMPQLETLGLKIRTFRPDNQPCDVTPKCLRQVALVLSTNLDSDEELIFDTVSFFQHLGISRISVDVVEMHKWEHRGFQSFRLPAELRGPSRVDVKNGFLFFRANDLRLTFSIFQYEPYLHLEGYSSVFSLTIPEIFWPDEVPPPMLGLRRLCIELLAVSDPWGYLEDCAGVFVVQFKTPWECPTLEEVEFNCSSRGSACVQGSSASCSHGCTDGGGTLCLGDVRSFIQSNLRYSSHRLRRISLTGVRSIADTDPYAEFVVLQELAEELVISKDASHEAKALSERWHARSSSRWTPTEVFDTALKYDFHASDALGPATLDVMQ